MRIPLQDKKARKLTKKRVCETVRYASTMVSYYYVTFIARYAPALEAQVGGVGYGYPGAQEDRSLKAAHQCTSRSVYQVNLNREPALVFRYLDLSD